MMTSVLCFLFLILILSYLSEEMYKLSVQSQLFTTFYVLYSVCIMTHLSTLHTTVRWTLVLLQCE